MLQRSGRSRGERRLVRRCFRWVSDLASGRHRPPCLWDTATRPPDQAGRDACRSTELTNCMASKDCWGAGRLRLSPTSLGFQPAGPPTGRAYDGKVRNRRGVGIATSLFHFGRCRGCRNRRGSRLPEVTSRLALVPADPNGGGGEQQHDDEEGGAALLLRGFFVLVRIFE